MSTLGLGSLVSGFLISSGLQPRPGAFTLLFLPFSFRRPCQVFHFPPQWRTHMEKCSLGPSFCPLWSLMPVVKVGIKPTCGTLRDSAQEAARSPQTALSPADSRSPLPPPSDLALRLYVENRGGGVERPTQPPRARQGAQVALNSKRLLGALTSNRGRNVHGNLTTSSPSPPA